MAKNVVLVIDASLAKKLTLESKSLCTGKLAYTIFVVEKKTARSNVPIGYYVTS